MLTLGVAVHRPQHKIVSPPLIKQKPFPIFLANAQPNSNAFVKVQKVVACTNTDEQLPEGLVPELMPKHVAVIMDGNRRWALQRRLPVILGHHAGGKSLEKMARVCDKLGIKVLTVFAFSTENWSRPKEETDFLMEMVGESLKSDMEKAIGLDIRVSVIGNRSMFPVSLQETVSLVEEVTKAKLGLHVMGAANYGGRYDILKACKSITKKVKDGVIQLQDINEGLFEQELETKCAHFPNPDLLIRTSGEVRLSNFLLWQMAHTELFFVEKLFPDFGEKDFVDVLISYQERRRPNFLAEPSLHSKSHK